MPSDSYKKKNKHTHNEQNTLLMEEKNTVQIQRGKIGTNNDIITLYK